MATLADNALTTVADVKETLGIDAGDTSKDNLIIRKINAASNMIERYCDRRFKLGTYTEYYDGGGGNELTLRNWPVIEIDSFGYRNVADNEDDFETVDVGDYFIDDTSGRIEYSSSFFGGFDRWKVVYTAGYATIPADLAEAAATLAAFMVTNSTSGTGVKSKQEGQRKIEYFDSSQGGLTTSIIEQLGIDDILDTYANFHITGLR